MDKLVYTWNDFNKDTNVLAGQINSMGYKYDSLFGIPRGGVPLAVCLSEKCGLPLRHQAGTKTLVCDDIIDSGRTRNKYLNNDFAALHGRPILPEIKSSLVRVENYVCNITSQWVIYPWETNEVAGTDTITRLLEFIGEDPNRPGLVDTPERVIKMYGEFFQGYYPDRKPKITIVPNGEDGVEYDEMLDDHGYFFSFCEHHILPFFGEYYFSYIPNKLILGASKIGRLVDYYAGKLQIAERLVNDIANEIEELIHPHGLMLIMRARHLCKEMRGLKKWNSPYEARAVRGFYKENRNNCKMEFLARLPR